jgi:hypothetical protein
MNGRCVRFGDSRRATAIAQTVVFGVLSGFSVFAWAGGMQFHEDPRIERREARWRVHPVAVLPELAHQVCTGGASTITAKELLEEVGARAVAPLLRSGASALPSMVDALCDDGDRRLRQAAQSELRRHGLAAVEAAIQPHGKSRHPTWLITDLLCQSPLNPSSLDGLLRRLAPLVSTQDRALGVIFWSPLAEIFARDQPGRVPRDCPNRQALAAGLVAQVLKPAALAGVPREHQPQLAGLLPNLLSATSPPTDPAPYARELAKLIESGIASRQMSSAYGLVRALADMGAAAAPAVPTLGHLIDKESATNDRPPRNGDWVAIPLESNLDRIAEAAVAIGPAARPLVDGLQKAYLRSVSRVCSQTVPFDADTLLRAVGVLDPTRWDALAAPTERAWKALDGCADRGPRWMQRNGTGGERLMTGIAAFGPRAASFGPRLRTVMIDEHRSLYERGQAARALQAVGTSLDAQEAALARVLAMRLAREERESRRPGVRKPPPTEMDAARTALSALQTCREDAGLGSAVVADEKALLSFSYEEHHRFAACIGDRMCGPGNALAETLATCCAYAAEQPEFCREAR